jgi:hypothetical protein
MNRTNGSLQGVRRREIRDAMAKLRKKRDERAIVERKREKR